MGAEATSRLKGAEATSRLKSARSRRERQEPGFIVVPPCAGGARGSLVGGVSGGGAVSRRVGLILKKAGRDSNGPRKALKLIRKERNRVSREGTEAGGQTGGERGGGREVSGEWEEGLQQRSLLRLSDLEGSSAGEGREEGGRRQSSMHEVVADSLHGSAQMRHTLQLSSRPSPSAPTRVESLSGGAEYLSDENFRVAMSRRSRGAWGDGEEGGAEGGSSAVKKVGEECARNNGTAEASECHGVGVALSLRRACAGVGARGGGDGEKAEAGKTDEDDVYVSGIVPGGGIHRSGRVREGDVLLNVDGRAVSGGPGARG